MQNNSTVDSVAVIGAGSWGTALASLLANKGIEVSLWTYESDVSQSILQSGENIRYFPGHSLPEKIRPTTSLREAVQNQNIIIWVTPTTVVRSLAQEIKPHLSTETLIVNCSKGIENDSLLTISGILNEVLGKAVSLAAMSGPTFAKEIAHQRPSAIVAASENPDLSKTVQALFSTNYLKVFTSSDLMGVELGGALKNVIAIATGISDGLGLGFNSRAGIITRGLVEIQRIGCALGARPETFSGLSGMGDLVLTCTGDLSRNRSVGLELGRGKALSEITSSMNSVAEGVTTVLSAHRLKEKLNIQAAIIEQTYQVVHNNKPPQEALKALMEHEISEEFKGVKGLG